MKAMRSEVGSSSGFNWGKIERNNVNSDSDPNPVPHFTRHFVFSPETSSSRVTIRSGHPVWERSNFFYSCARSCR